MEYISAEEFLKQPKEAQKVFKEWWKPEIGDLVYVDCIEDNAIIIKKEVSNYYGICLIKENAIVRHNIKCNLIPLFAEGQLRKFIEDKLNSKIEIVYASKEGVRDENSYYRIEKVNFLDGDINKSVWKVETDDLLQAYWKVAIKIAEKEVKANE